MAVNPQTSPILVHGPLALDVGSRILTGPARTTILTAAEMSIIRPLMTRTIVGFREPRDDAVVNAAHRPAIRMRVLRAKQALERVGVPGRMIYSVRGLGYHLVSRADLPARVFTGHKLELLERVLRTHPDRALVAELRG